MDPHDYSDVQRRGITSQTDKLLLLSLPHDRWPSSVKHDRDATRPVFWIHSVSPGNEHLSNQTLPLSVFGPSLMLLPAPGPSATPSSSSGPGLSCKLQQLTQSSPARLALKRLPLLLECGWAQISICKSSSPPWVYQPRVYLPCIPALICSSPPSWIHRCSSSSWMLWIVKCSSLLHIIQISLWVTASAYSLKCLICWI